jgi:amino acid transporter
MELHPEDNGTTVLHRTADYRPPSSWRTWLIGRPLATADADQQSIGKFIGLAVFASDALSSTAYATQEMMLILAMAGAVAYPIAIPLAMAVVVLLVILTLSYEQTIHAYPGGGGAYIVARDNLGEMPAKAAAAALLTDYILTVAVSISSGVAQIVSAVPVLFPYRVEISVGLVLFVMMVNLRGIKESGSAFAAPSYFFLVMMYLTVIIGLVRFAFGSLGTVVDPPPLELLHGAQALSLFLILRAFSSGTTALTGVEAISNGIRAFKEPRSHNAGLTLIWMSGILGSLMMGVTFLAVHVGAVPAEHETLISQLARTALGGRNALYLATIGSTTLILIMAANTSFAGFPLLSALAAADGFLPRQLTFRGSRLVFSRGIVALGLIASLLIILFRASVSALIPLYAIGVFVSFSLSQAGMARRWFKCGRLGPSVEIKERGSTLRFDSAWRFKMIVNGLGAALTIIVSLVFAITKFVDGAWVVVILTPILVFVFSHIHSHYVTVAHHLSLDDFEPTPPVIRHRVLVPISGVHKGSLTALRYARLVSSDVTVVHVSTDPEETKRIQHKWETWGEGVRLVVLDSPFRLLVEPLLAYIQELEAQRQPNEIITIVVPHFVPRHWWNNMLHTQTAVLLRLALLFKPGIVITDVPYHIEQ